MIKVLHASLEYKKGVGGIKSVLMGLLPALQRKSDLNVAVITPFYDVYNGFYPEEQLKLLGIISHIYKGKIFKSEVWQVCTDNIESKELLHYLLRPIKGSPVAWLFNIQNEQNLYQPFPHSEPTNRVEYFIGALASLIRLGLPDFPTYDILHAHAWHSSLSASLIKEFENLSLYKELNASNSPLRPIPHILSNVHMLTSAEHGQLTSIDSVKGFLTSLGLQQDLVFMFPNHRNSIQENFLKRVVFSLLYSDMVNMVSKGLRDEVTNGKAAGLEKIFAELAKNNRLYGITNGISVDTWDATNPKNLPEFYFRSDKAISSSKQEIKNLLVTKYPKLQANKIWFLFIGRFASEKGMDMLKPALEAIRKVGANFIIMGMHIATMQKNNQKVSMFQELIDEIKQQPDTVVIDNAVEQKEVGRLFRAATQYMLVLSHNEACGLVSMEGLTNATLSVAPKIQGIPDSVRHIPDNPTDGTGFLYSDDPETRNKNLEIAIKEAHDFYQQQIVANNLDGLLNRLIKASKVFDWDATPSQEYQELYKRILLRPILTWDQIRLNKIPSLLPQFSANVISPFRGKIFQLGFNKCGSQTIHNYLWLNGIKCLHYGDKNGPIARKVIDNYQRGEPLFGLEYDQYQGFFDMEDPYATPPIYIPLNLFEILDQQYPDSKFILNTRNKDNWIKSRLSHMDPTNGKKYADVLKEYYKCSEQELVMQWSSEWDWHHAAVTQYFANRPNTLLIINIDEGTNLEKGQKIADFLAGRFRLDPALFGHLNKTPETNKVPAKTEVNASLLL